MIDIRALDKSQSDSQTGRTYLQEYTESLRNRGGDVSLIDTVLELNRERKQLIQDLEQKRAAQNKSNQIIAQKKRGGEDASELLAELHELSQSIKECDEKLARVEHHLQDVAAGLPNKLHHSTPVGASEKNNVVVRSVGSPPQFSFAPHEHWEIGEQLNIIDFERAAKVSGSRFAFLRGAGARLERALMSFMLDLHTTENGYEEIWPPFIVNKNSLFGTGQLPKFAEDLFALANTEYFLVPTAEVPLTNLHRDEILAEGELPKCFVAYSPCFRAEAGSYGKDTKGLIRQHQFDKVELVQIIHPDQSYAGLEELTGHAETILKKLELPYRVMTLCTGDMGFSSAKTYDIEVWLPGQSAYREISSCSNFESFQARRMQARFRNDKNKPELVHTLNGSGLAVGRTLVAVLENYQRADGGVDIPAVLQPYMGGLKALEPVR